MDSRASFSRLSTVAPSEPFTSGETMMFAPDTQIAFNAKKGSIPIRTDVDGSSLDVCAQAGMKMVADPARQVPDINLVAEPALVGALDDGTEIGTLDQQPAEIAREMRLLGKGLSYSAISHAHLFAQKEAVVVGSGSAARG